MVCNQLTWNHIKVAYAFVISRINSGCSQLLLSLTGLGALGLHLHGKLWVLHPALATAWLGVGLLGLNMFGRAAVKYGNAV